MIFLYSDILYRAGGIETYLHVLALHLHGQNIPFRIVVAELEPCPLLDELQQKGIEIYRQPRVLGDRWLLRQQIMLAWLSTQLKPGDWVFCVRQPMPKLYLKMVRCVHRCRAKIAASWALAPEFSPPIPPSESKFIQAVFETDAVISVSRCTLHQFKEIYEYTGKVFVVPYHNFLFFDRAIDLPSEMPWKIGFIGRLDIRQKNLDILLEALVPVIQKFKTVELHLYGRGSGQRELEALADRLNITEHIVFHGAYDHRKDLPQIMANCHFFVYPSQFEGGPCFTLLEMMQAGRFCVASRVGGIPDLYEGFPSVGLLVSPGNVSELSQGIVTALTKVANGEIDGNAIRDRYFDGFDIASAHQAWVSVFGDLLQNEKTNRKC
jgi:glycosyltransferase involved in cell wall biosynthesis